MVGEPSGLGDHSPGCFGKRPLTLVKPIRVGKGLNRHTSLCVLAGGGWVLDRTLTTAGAMVSGHQPELD